MAKVVDVRPPIVQANMSGSFSHPSPSTPERAAVRDTADLRKFVAEKSTYGFVNSRGMRLHARGAAPAQGCKAIFAHFHGINDHCNRPNHIAMQQLFVDAGYGLIMFDDMGHGHSEGSRALLDRHIVDDCVQFLELALAARADSPSSSSPLGFPQELDAVLTDPSVPFFVMGHSMGGLLAVHASARAAANALLAPRFRGSVFLSPAVEVEMVSPVAEFFLKKAASVMPRVKLPQAVHKSFPIEDIVVDQEYGRLCMLEQTARYNPTDQGTFSHGGGLRLGTGVAIKELLDALPALQKEISFPFVILHDPEDKVTFISGSRAFMAGSERVTNKQLLERPGMLHGLLDNDVEATVAIVTDWAAKQLEEKAN